MLALSTSVSCVGTKKYICGPRCLVCVFLSSPSRPYACHFGIRCIRCIFRNVLQTCILVSGLHFSNFIAEFSVFCNIYIVYTLGAYWLMIIIIKDINSNWCFSVQTTTIYCSYSQLVRWCHFTIEQFSGSNNPSGWFDAERGCISTLNRVGYLAVCSFVGIYKKGSFVGWKLKISWFSVVMGTRE